MEEPASVRYSVVIPVFNEEATLRELARRLSAVFAGLDGSAEFVLVDDGSTDGSFEIMSELASADRRFRAIRLSRNFGHQVALTAGLDVVRGDAVVVMDADLQDPPEVVPALVARWREGFDVVHAVRVAREGEPALRARRAALFYRMLRRVADVEIPVDVGDFRLVDKVALTAFRSMRERNRYLRGMFAWVGFRQTTVEFVRASRFAGESKYPFRELLALATNGLLGFSNEPLRLALRLGFAISAVSFVFGAVSIAAKLAGMYSVPGIASLVVLTAFLGGIQLTLLGVQGEYIARIHEEVKRRPLYLVSEMRGFERGSDDGVVTEMPFASSSSSVTD